MKVAIASGKGGTGKTTTALALAEAAGPNVHLLDCDVEEPNCHLFAAQGLETVEAVNAQLPEFVADKCVGCGSCVKVCRFHALAKLGKKVLVFPELCHSCQGCILSCPGGALQPEAYPIGEIRHYRPGKVKLSSGVMKVGYSMAPPVIKAVKKLADEAEDVIFDAPPGTACPMVTTVRGCDWVLLVTEPTPFGLHDLKLAYNTVKTLDIPCKVILNRAGDNDRIVEDFCRDNGIELALKIPFSTAVAQGYAEGRSLLESMPELRESFVSLWQNLRGDR